jgi:hypothetical protein
MFHPLSQIDRRILPRRSARNAAITNIKVMNATKSRKKAAVVPITADAEGDKATTFASAKKEEAKVSSYFIDVS